MDKTLFESYLNEYESFSDEELLKKMTEGDDNIEDYLLEKYKYLVRKRARSLYLIGADTDDLIQEGMIGLCKAIRFFDDGRDASFFTFADLCIKRQMYNAIKGSNRNKNMPLNNYVSISSLSENPSDELFNNPEAMVISKENSENLKLEMKRQLSEYENQVISLYIEGLTYVEIAEKLGKSPKSVDNALTRVKKKILEIVDEINDK